MKVDILSINGEKTGKEVELPEEIFGIEPNEHATYLAVKQYLAHQRQGTHKSKERNEIAGSTKKIKRQKGTGTARAGDIKNPLFRGGGRVFGPRPRNYTVRLNKKVKSLARKSALSAKVQDNGIVVVEDFSFDAPKTKAYLKILSDLKVEGKSLLVTASYDDTLHRSSRNIPGANIMAAKDLHTYSILNNKTIILSEGAVEVIKETFK